MNKKGFVASAVLYSLLLLFLALILGLLALLSNRKMILDRLKNDIKGNITKVKLYEKYDNGEVIYYNPVKGEICSDYSENNSKTGVKDGCLKWYIFNDTSNNDTINLLLDHNITPLVPYNSTDNSEMKEVKTALESDTKGWKNEARLITAEEIAHITQADKILNWQLNKEYLSNATYEDNKISYFYFNGKEGTDKTWRTKLSTEKGKNSYAWLFDYTYNCTKSGCNIEDNEKYTIYNGTATNYVLGYWTSDGAYKRSDVSWSVHQNGILHIQDSTTNNYYGVRPVIKIEKTKLKETTEYTYGYTGGEQTFVAPLSGKYKIEAWGAQGDEIANTGFGGYSKGEINLTKGNLLYVVVGGKGQKAGKGGYNGGGTGSSNNDTTYGYSTGGGGATHVALQSGTLSSIGIANKDKILIVAGSGGGHSGWQNNGSGGSGGGYIGASGTGIYSFIGKGGTQSSGGEGYFHENGSFGLGGSYTNTNSAGGAGAGFYGGGSAANGGAGGGSGYIGNPSLTNKVMYCYNCEESKDALTKTINTSNIAQSPVSNYAKKGNGFVKITYLGEEEKVKATFTNMESNIATAKGNVIDPYYIEKVEDLVLLSKKVSAGNSYNGKTIVLLNNIDFKNKNNYLNTDSKEYGDINNDGKVETIYQELTTSAGFMPIGNDKVAFSGKFDGGNNTISNLLINRTEPYQGLFGNNAGSITNLIVSGNVKGIFRVSGIASYNKGTIENVVNNANVTMNLVSKDSSDAYYFSFVGGISGYNKGNILRARNYGKIEIITNAGTNAPGYAGGISANNESTIDVCYNAGNIIGTSSYGTFVGGIVGQNSGTITDVYNTANINSTATVNSMSSGIVGANYGSITNSYSIGSVNSNQNNKCLTYNVSTGSTKGTVTNSYYLNSCSLGGEGTSKTSAELKELASTLGYGFKLDKYQINSGYPVLVWQ